MNPSEKKEFAEIVGGVIDKKVTPRLERLESGQKQLESGQGRLENLSKAIMEQVVQNPEDVTILQENVKDVLLTEERIETKVDASIRRQDDLSIKYDQVNRRVLHLESKKT